MAFKFSKSPCWIVTLAVSCLIPGASCAPAQIADGDAALERAKNLVVMVDGKFNQPTQGAGVVFAVDNQYAYVATVFHVVRQAGPDGGPDRLATELKVRFYSDPGRSLGAFHVAALAQNDAARAGSDLAVLRVKVAGAGLDSATFDFARIGDLGLLKNGSLAYAVGQPGKDWGVTYQPGSISDVGQRWLEVQSTYIVHGHSGGALIDREGRIFGMVEDTDGTTARALRIDRALDSFRADFKLPVQLTARPSLPGEERANPGHGLTYVWIPPGTFLGCSETPPEGCGDEPPHYVTLSRGFWMGETEVTQEAYRRVTKKPNPSHFKGSRLPVDSVTWEDANACCVSAGGLRLPTEAEWEYAARAGKRSATYGDLNDIAWYSGNLGGAPGGTQEVGRKTANAWNLRDMLGNVWEWTADWYDSEYYRDAPQIDPKGPGKPTGSRVLRGGSWDAEPELISVSGRMSASPTDRFGFRWAGELH